MNKLLIKCSEKDFNMYIQHCIRAMHLIAYIFLSNKYNFLYIFLFEETEKHQTFPNNGISCAE